MNPLVKYLAIKLRQISTIALSFIALALVVFSLWLPNLSQYRAEAENWLSENLKRPVHLGGLTARWHGVGPELIFTDIAVSAPDRPNYPALKLPEVRVTVALLESILAREIKLRQIILSQVHLGLKLKKDKTLSVTGLEKLELLSRDGGSTPIPYRIGIEASEIVWENELTGTPPQSYTGIQAELRSGVNRHQVNARLPIPGQSKGLLELRADLRGSISPSGQWDADLYLRGTDVALATLLNAYPPVDVPNIQDGTANMESWWHWSKGELSRVTGRLDLHGVKVETANPGEAATDNRFVYLDQTGGDFDWRSQPEGWQLTLEDLTLTRDGKRWPPTRWALRVNHDNRRQLNLSAGIQFARVEDAMAVASTLPLPWGEFKDRVASLAPHTDLRDFRLNFRQQNGQNLWSMQGKFTTLSTQPWKRLPGVSHLDGSFWIDQDKGALQLDGTDTNLSFPHLFRNPLQLQRLRGNLTWTRETEGGWRLDSRNIMAVTRDIHTRTRLTMEIPEQSGKPVLMDLHTDFSDGLAVNAHHYYPVGIMPEAVVKWLDRSIVDGQVVSGSAVVRGPLDDFPYHKTHNGVFEVFFRCRAMTIDYWPQWPPLTNVSAQVRFLNNSFHTWIDQGTIFDSQLVEAEGSIADLAGSSPVVFTGNVRGPLQDTLRLLRESPLASNFSSLTEGLRSEGSADTRIDMEVPITSSDAFRLDGAVKLAGAVLHLEDWHLPLTGITGELAFGHDHVKAQGLEASLLGSRISVDVATLDQATRITARGPISRETLTQYAPETANLPFSGSSIWNLRLDVPHAAASRKDVEILATSALTGTAIDLPLPLGKSPKDSGDIRVSTTLGKATAQPVRVRYGTDFELLLLPEDQGGIERATVQLGGGPAELADAPGIEIRGTLPTLDLAAWWKLADQPTGSANSPPLQHVQLHLERAQFGDITLNQFDVDLRREGARLAGTVRSQRLEGIVEIPLDQSTQPLKATMERLDLEFDPSWLATEATNPPEANPAPLEPSRIPATDLTIKKVNINGHAFGELRMVTSQLPEGLKLQDFSLNSELAQIAAHGQWIHPVSSPQLTQLEFSLATRSLGEFLEKCGFSRNIDGAPGEFGAELNWPSDPLGYRTELLAGNIDLQLGNGRFLEVEPGVGRIFGLLNLTALQRRLRLDFSDLTQKGLAFDHIEGSFRLKDGSAYTTNLSITGPSAQIDILGRTDLVTEELDQLITITPRVSGALPVAGFLAGGPIGGAAMLVAQGLFGDEFDKASQRQYEVKGPWSEPVFTLSQPPGSSAEPNTPEPIAASQHNRKPPADPDTDSSRNSGEVLSPADQPEPKEGLFQRLKNSLKPRSPSFEETRDGTLGVD